MDGPFVLASVWLWSFFKAKTTYRKVTSSNTSRLEAHAGLWRRFLILMYYVSTVTVFDKSWFTRIRTRNCTVSKLRLLRVPTQILGLGKNWALPIWVIPPLTNAKNCVSGNCISRNWKKKKKTCSAVITHRLAKFNFAVHCV